MRKKWRLRNHGDVYVIVRRAELFPEELGLLSPRITAAEINRWLSDTASRQILLDLYQNVRGRASNNLHSSAPDELHKTIKPWLEQSLRSRELVVIPVPVARVSQGYASDEDGDDAESPPAPPRPPIGESKSKTWIEIELVDAQGAPVPHERFRLELPDGTFHEDSLDARGRARVDGIDPGTCELNFINRDLNEWQPA